MSPDTKHSTSGRGDAASGRFLLRLDPGLHAALRAAAAAAGLSLNDYCVRRLAAPAGGGAVLAPATACVRRAAHQFGEGLVGLVLFGSWVRDEAGAQSDVDLLVVVDRSVPLTRALYRRWGEEAVDVEGHPVEVHFVHPPQRDDRPGGLWAEVALDGVVLFERGLAISRQLAWVRRAILAGRLIRRTAHGQPYWVEVA